MSEGGAGIFSVEDAFFVLDSNTLADTKSRLYGYCFRQGELIDRYEDLRGEEPDTDGCFILIRREGETLTITQDSVGCYGLFLFREGEYFALSNSFLRLVDHIKADHRITLNREYADYLISADMCSAVMEETLVREILALDRSAVVTIHIAQKELSYSLQDYNENTVDPATPEGIALLDSWRNKWVGRIRSVISTSRNVRTDLSGGFDSRETMSLLLSSGADLGRIMVYSKQDDQKTHTEDYQIASAISKRYGFVLNDNQYLSREFSSYSLEDIYRISFDAKLGFHKQMYYTLSRQTKRRYTFTGFGGAVVRNFCQDSTDEYIQKAVARCHPFAGNSSEERERMELSIRHVMERNFAALRRKYSILGRSLPEEEITQRIYLEARNRYHFGKSTLVQFLANVITLSPLLDPDLHKLKLSSPSCPDNNLLASLIMSRYTPGLLDFPFDSGRSIHPETIHFAQRLNRDYPFAEPATAPEVHIWKEEHIPRLAPSEPVKKGVPDETMRYAFFSDDFRALFETVYSPVVYEQICKDIRVRKYYPMSTGYAALAVGRIIRDTADPGAVRKPFISFLIEAAQKEQLIRAHETGQSSSETAPPDAISLPGRILRKLRAILRRSGR